MPKPRKVSKPKTTVKPGSSGRKKIKQPKVKANRGSNGGRAAPGFPES